MKTAERITSQKIKLKMFNLSREDFFDTLDKIKSLKVDERYYDSSDKSWVVISTPENVVVIKKIGFSLPEAQESKEIKLEAQEIENEEIKNNLFPYQKIGVDTIEHFNGRVILGDEMGLGKTIQAIGYISLHSEFKNILVVCPASLKINWSNEIKKWLGESSNIIGKNEPNNQRIQIINYDIIRKYEEEFSDIDLIIFDECHYLKNKKAQRTQISLKIAKKINHIIAISGTPIVNRPSEFWNVLNLARPDIFDNWWFYAKRYCDLNSNGFGLTYNGSTNPEELHKTLIETCMIRRLKSEVLPDLPEKIKSVIPIELTNQKEYDYASDDFSSWLYDTEQKHPTVETLQRIEKLKQLSAKGKMQGITEWIENFLEEKDKLVIMATHHETIDCLKETFSDISVKLDGRDSQENRQKAVELFQTDDNIKLFIGNIKAAGVGITLTKASSICFCEFPWSPGELIQAEDRIHRIGQKESCNTYFFVGLNTIDEEIIDLLDSKKQTIDSVLDGQITDEESLLKSLLKKIKGE